ncbi:DUF6243 family protein [Nocardiopsis sediminis]|uniref:DUF6243 family protein n=1 Tax=Nocardiopsis sediminis TaxID=1778267 RepID=A0ABV8FRU4_9ACTN
MGKSRDNLLGLGGQRTSMSRGAMRGSGYSGKGGRPDPLEEKRELLRKLKEKRDKEREAQEGDESGD